MRRNITILPKLFVLVAAFASLSGGGASGEPTDGVHGLADPPPCDGRSGCGGGSAIVDIETSFEVLNVNRSNVPCSTDGRRYRVRGTLTGPADVVYGAHPAATVFVSGAHAPALSYYRYDGAGGAYDVARRMAELGHVSVVVERLGFGGGDVPNGWNVCPGGEGDVVHQVIEQLRAGTYRAEGDPVAFEKLALAGVSLGGIIVTNAAHSFRNVDALVLLASAWEGLGPPEDLTLVDVLVGATREWTTTCPLGGKPKRPGAPRGYTRYLHDFSVFFHDADPAVFEHFLAAGELEGCGILTGLGQALLVNRLLVGTIDVPVFLIGGEFDPVFNAAAVERQRSAFSGSDDVTATMLEEANHAFVLERGMVDGLPAAERFHLALSKWLSSRGF